MYFICHYLSNLWCHTTYKKLTSRSKNRGANEDHCAKKSKFLGYKGAEISQF